MFVYLIESEKNPGKHYVGITNDLKKRLQYHNSGKSPYTARSAPWRIVVSIWFEDEAKARAFEQYLKDGSGHAFLKKHFL